LWYAALHHVAAKPSLHGVTRGKRLVVLVGQKKAVAIAVRNVSGRRRWSKLGEWLRPGPRISPQQIGLAG
jgi:exodeoxyribonuclease V alpha subunit